MKWSFLLQTDRQVYSAHRPVRSRKDAPWKPAAVAAVAALTLMVQGWTGIANGETASADDGCRLLPIAELESHFGAQATAVRASESLAGTMCSADLPDRRQGAELLSKPAGTSGPTMEERLAALKRPLELRGAQIESFGSVACFTDHTKIAGATVFTATCFQEAGGHISLSLRSVDQQRVSVEAAKELLKTAVLKRE
ncbi:MAG: hypothetical protein AB7G68_13810 [Nitrospiraceae bacterium]